MPAPKQLPIGQRVLSFPAGTVNSLVDKYYRDLALEMRREQAGMTSVSNRPWLVGQILNSTEEQVEPGEILGYSEPVQSLDDPPDGDPSQVHDAPVLKGIIAAVPEHRSQFAIAIDYIPPDTIGPCVIGGLTWVAVSWSDEAHDRIKVEEGEYLLISATSGIKPIWHAPIPDSDDLPALVWALINLGGGGGATGEINFSRARTATGFSAAVGWSVADAGAGQADILDDDGSIIDTVDCLNNYFNSLLSNHPGWVFSDGTNKWFVNIGCAPGTS